MPLMSSLASNYVTKETPLNPNFLDQEIHQKAVKDFCYLVTQSKLGYSVYLKHIVVSSSKTSCVGDFVVLGANVEEAKIEFPQSIFSRQDKAYVAIVMYENGEVQGVYVHSLEDLKNKNGLFSIYKYLKKQQKYAIILKKYKNGDKYRFGYVLRDYIDN